MKFIKKLVTMRNLTKKDQLVTTINWKKTVKPNWTFSLLERDSKTMLKCYKWMFEKVEGQDKTWTLKEIIDWTWGESELEIIEVNPEEKKEKKDKKPTKKKEIKK